MLLFFTDFYFHVSFFRYYFVQLFENGATSKPFVYSNRFSVRHREYSIYESTYTFFAKNGKMGVKFYTGPSYNTYGYDGFELIYTVQAGK